MHRPLDDVVVSVPSPVSSAVSVVAVSADFSICLFQYLHVLCLRRCVFFAHCAAVGSFCIHHPSMCQFLGGISFLFSALFMAAVLVCVFFDILVLFLSLVQ